MKNAADQYDKYYEDVEKSAPFAEEMEGGKSHRRNFALKHFRKIGISSILDVGCGPGFDAIWFKKNGFDVSAIDISRRVINYAGKKNPGPRYFVWNIEKKPFKKIFSGIYAFEIIEHMFDHDSFLINLNRSLKDSGLLVLSTPNVLAPKNRLKVLIGKDEWFESKYHVHFFSPRILRQSFEKNGFEILDIVSSGKISFLGPNYGGSIIAAVKKIRNV
jgi:2-polyprenyl-3-methyl-5-hydroxy-6-metoxy-1,4-benzoquinol methylase